jgi:glycosyltransferase involved in cell wall biosynthesis
MGDGLFADHVSVRARAPILHGHGALSQVVAGCLFITYTGLLEPLGVSQVLPYVRGLAWRGYRMAILSFEKEVHGSDRFARTRRLLDQEGIAWHALRYHKRPPVLSTVLDVASGVMAGRRASRSVRFVHARGHVAALIAFSLWKLSGVPFLFDHRGRMADEYADAGIWPAGGLLYRLTERWEQRFIRHAARTVVLTERLRAALGPYADRSVVIPCAVDLSAFRPRERGVPVNFDLVYAGSWSGLYLGQDILRFFEVYRKLRPDARLLVLVPRPTDLRAAPRGVELRVAAPEEVPALLRSAGAGLSLRRPGRAQVAASPVKISEYLASGLPVVTSPGVGDLDKLVPQRRVGIVLPGFSEDDMRRAGEDLIALQEEGLEVGRRCRVLAEERYGLDAAIETYDQVYRAILAGGNS